MSQTVFMVKLVKKDTESVELFEERKKLYKKAIEKHNLMVWAGINKNSLSVVQNLFKDKRYSNVQFVSKDGATTSFEEIANTDPRYKAFNPYYDSGFDIFQPQGTLRGATTFESVETKDYSLCEGTHLVGLGVKTAMYEVKCIRGISEMVNLPRKITIYHNLENITDESLGEYSQKRFNMILNTDWDNQIPIPFKLHPRSSIYKKAIRQANCTGIIDTGYRGELGAAVDCLGLKFGRQDDQNRTTLECGKRYFQVCRTDLEPFYVMLLNENDDLPSTERGEGGFGSTGQ